MSAFDQISPYHLFPFLYVSMNASLTNQRSQMAVQAHLKGNILYCVPGNYYKKNSSRIIEI